MITTFAVAMVCAFFCGGGLSFAVAEMIDEYLTARKEQY